MPKTHKIVLLAYEGFELLDLTGPSTVFSEANLVLGREAYELVVASPEGGMVRSWSGLALDSVALNSKRCRNPDSILVSGALQEGLAIILSCALTRRWLGKWAPLAERYGSVCSGAFMLAACGLLDGKEVATHWSVCDRLEKFYPSLKVNADALYVNDGRVWTSAGVSSGIDMSLGIVEQDYGAEIAARIARLLVLYSRRPGYQSQFSDVLLAQSQADAPFRQLIAWMQANLSEKLDVETLASQAAMSERTFTRKFTRATGQSPARFVESLRLEAARDLMASNLSLKSIADSVGLLPASRFNRVFMRRYGVAPSAFRHMQHQ